MKITVINNSKSKNCSANSPQMVLPTAENFVMQLENNNNPTQFNYA